MFATKKQGASGAVAVRMAMSGFMFATINAPVIPKNRAPVNIHIVAKQIPSHIKAPPVVAASILSVICMFAVKAIARRTEDTRLLVSVGQSLCSPQS